MEEKKEKRGKELFLFGIRVLVFGLLSLAMIVYTTYVLTPKSDYGMCSMINYYEQPRESIDVLAIGTSLFYAGINTNVLWEEYGISAYDLCSAEQPYWASYYIIKEALKTQKPKVILLDAKPSVYVRDYSKRGRTVLSTFGIRGLENRIGATLACVEKPQDAISYLLGIPQVHSNYEKTTAEDFIYPPSNGNRGSDWKGFIEMDITEKKEKPSVVWNDIRKNINEREEEYVRKIFQLCKDEDVELMLVGVPNPDYLNDHMYYNALWYLAEQYGVSGVNYNDPELRFGLRYSTDFADWQHLNVKGSITFSRKLGQDLKERYDLPDHRGDEMYASYDECARIWYEKFPDYAQEEL